MADEKIVEDVVDDSLSVDKVEEGRASALTDNKEIYYGTDGTGGLIGDAKAAYDKAMSQFVIDPDDGFESAAEMQIANQNASYQQTLNEIGQAKEQASKDYTKEQAGSYVDYMKGIDPFGVNAEQMAAMGISRSGYNENSQVQAYVAYQNRVAVARESFNKLMLEYSNQMERARISNDAAIAQIYATSAEQLAALQIESVAAVGQLVGQYQTQQNNINTRYDNLWQHTWENVQRLNEFNADEEQRGIDNAFKDRELTESERVHNETIKQQNRENIESTILATGIIPSEAALEAAGMTMEEAQALKGRYEDDKASKKITAQNEAQSHIIGLLQSGAPISKEQMEAAGWTQEDVDALNELYNPKIQKTSQISSNVDTYLANGDVKGATSYAEKNKGELSTDEYQGIYFNIATTLTDAEDFLEQIAKWKNSGKLSASDYASLTAYYYSQLGTSGKTAGVELTSAGQTLSGGNFYTYNGSKYASKNTIISSDKQDILNGIATGNNGKTPAHGTLVMYDGKYYVFDSFTEKTGFLGLGGEKTESKWRELGWHSGSNDTLKDALTTYSNTHEAAEPEHFSNPWSSYEDAAKDGVTSLLTEADWRKAPNRRQGTTTYQEYLDLMYKKYKG